MAAHTGWKQAKAELSNEYQQLQQDCGAHLVSISLTHRDREDGLARM